MLKYFPQYFSLAAIVGMAILAPASNAHAGYKIYSPTIEEGEVELEWRGSYDFNDGAHKNGSQEHLYGIGYGVTDKLFIEAYGKATKNAAAAWQYEATQFEAIYQFTNENNAFLSSALYGEYKIANQHGSADSIEAKILLEKSVGLWTHRLNAALEKEIGANSEDKLEGEIAWSSSYYVSNFFQPAIEYYAEIGTLNNIDRYGQQNHHIGPAIYGKAGPIKYDVGVLKGISNKAQDYAVKWNLEYEF
ncbi:MAG: hypothetical protein ACOYK8_05195 [Alphaproteobacteria bacterium]